MVEVPDADDVMGSLADSGKAAGGALVGMQFGRQLVSGNPQLGAAAGGVAGSLMTGKSAENKAAATYVMLNALPAVLNGQLMGGGQQSQEQSVGAPASI